MVVVSILTDNQIRGLIGAGVFNVNPNLTQKQFQPASLDWRIGAVEIFDSATIEANSPEYLKRFADGSKFGQSYGGFTDSIDSFFDSLEGEIRYLENDESFVIESGQQAIIYSLEQFNFCDGLFVQSELRSSNGRRGLSPIDGYINNLTPDGRVKMSVVNKNPNPLKFYGSDRFAQLFFEPIDTFYKSVLNNQVQSTNLNNSPCQNLSSAQIMDSDGIKYLIQNGLLEVGSNSEEVKIYNNQLVFTCSDTALMFRNDCGIIDTRAKYKDETLYETINLTSEYKLSKNDLLVVKLQEQLKLSSQVGILLQPSQTLNAKHVFNHKVGAGWVDPGYEGQVTMHDWSHYHNMLEQGKIVMTGIVYHFLKPVGNSYGAKDLGSHYNKKQNGITASV